MKKKILLLSLLSITQICVLGSVTRCNEIRNKDIKKNKIEAREKLISYVNDGSRNYNIAGIGYSINTIKDSPLVENIVIKNDIFNPSFLNSKFQEKNPIIINGSNVIVEKGNTIEDINLAISAKYEAKAEASVKVKKLFNLSASTNFKVGVDVNYQKNSQSFFYHAQSVSNRYKYSLPNTAILRTYCDNLDEGYCENLENAYKTKNYFDFFNLYGTHVIMGGTFGGSLDTYYSMTSNSLDLDIGAELSISNKIEAVITKKLKSIGDLQASAETKFDFTADYKYSKSNTHEIFSTKAYGGGTFYCGDVDDLNLCIKNWTSTIEGNETLIQFDELVPLWKLIPTSFSNQTQVKNEMEDAFSRYAEIYSYLPSYSFSTSNKVTYDYLIRENDAKIVEKNCNIYKNCESIDLVSGGAKPSIMKKAGFQKVRLYVDLGVKGSQESKNIYIKTKNKYGEWVALDLRGLSNSFSTYYNYKYYFDVDINKLVDSDEIYLLYGGTTTWSNKRISLKVEYGLC